jgi:site-specific DNA-methyltransferase (adenine-specific)
LTYNLCSASGVSNNIMLGINKIYKGDCLDVMRQIDDNAVDAVMTDPFYGSSGRDGAVHLGYEKDVFTFGNKMSSDSFIWFVRSYSKELYRITKDDTHCYIFSDWRKYKDVQVAFEIAGWELRSLIVWNKGNGMGEFWRSCHEFILFFTKRHPRKLNHGGCMNVLNHKPINGKQKFHQNQKPVPLLKDLIIASTQEGDLIIDPFSGSGSTAEAAKSLNRNYICIEIEERFVLYSMNRLQYVQSEMWTQNNRLQPTPKGGRRKLGA